jgi:hypothetical protein
MKAEEKPILSMDTFRKAFLFAVGIIAVAYEEAEKAAQEAREAIEERAERMSTPKVS